MGMSLISLCMAVNSNVEMPVLSETRGQCDADAMVKVREPGAQPPAQFEPPPLQ